ncbi:sugar 3,4-ketoisomerase [Shivajiella indica]|uniref:Sugar 3,4-ketoisomerase n=1 Tax=Shivajiella indica TaxID=872115 RepID=A0ABW5BE20_9BACT
MNPKIIPPRLIQLESKVNPTGKLTFFEGTGDFPFPIKRSFWIRGVPEGRKRGVHAHKRETQLLICLQGMVSVQLEDLAGAKFNFHLDQAEQALLIPPLIWSSVTFGSNVILLVLADLAFDEEDYIRKKDEFKALQDAYLKGDFYG